MSCYLSCENIEIKAGFNTLISSFSLDVCSSQSIAITGPNGCGKTSLLRVLAGLSKPHCGKIISMNEQLWPSNEIKHEHYSVFLSNIPSLLLDHSVLWNMEFYTQTYGLKFNIENYITALKKVGLEERLNQTTRTLSTGQKRRLSLAGLLLIKPNIILADEPTNGLDETGCALCLNIFNELQTNYNAAIIVATHDQKVINWCNQNINLEKYIPNAKKIKMNVKALL
jgi:ABC-type multidrug transport system ATPase subunit